MNLVQLAPMWVVTILAVALVAAATEDVVRLRISNLTVAAVLIIAAVAVAIVGPSIELWQNFALLAVFLAIGTGMFSAGLLGGGDVKLFAAVALWFDLQTSLFLLAAVFMAGGLLALIFIFSRIILRRDRPNVSGSRKVLPYGVAIAAGSLIVIAFERDEAASGHSSPLEVSIAPTSVR